jgi:hypothetical protein
MSDGTSTIARGDRLMAERGCARRLRAENFLMGYVSNFHDRRWVDDDTPGAAGYRYIEIVADGSEYTNAFSCELVRLGPGDQPLPHVEPYTV